MAREWVISEEDLGCDGAYFSYEEVVRCRYCKCWDKDDEYCVDFLTTDPDGYCAWGERNVKDE